MQKLFKCMKIRFTLNYLLILNSPIQLYLLSNIHCKLLILLCLMIGCLVHHPFNNKLLQYHTINKINRQIKFEMSKQFSNYSQEFKGEVNRLTEARQNIENGHNISDSMVQLNKTLKNIDPHMKRQSSFIKNFFSHQNSSNAKQKQSETRRYLNRICQITMKQINGLLDIGDEYFSLDFKNSWSKISHSFEKDLTKIREETDQHNMTEFLFKIINVKDYIMTEIFKSMIYKKCLLFKDLNIIEIGYVHSEKKAITQQIQNYMMEKGFIPTKPEFEWCGFDVKGQWSLNKMAQSESDMKDVFKIASEQLQSVCNVIRNYANLNSEQREHEDIKRNVENVKSLRKQIEDSKYAYSMLEKKYRQASSRDQKVTDSLQLREKVATLEEALEEKQNELKLIKFEFRDSSAQMSNLQNKIKQLESDINRLTNVEMTKLKEVEIIQKGLNEEFVRISKQTNNFGAMFEFQSHGKKSLANQIISKQHTIEKLVDILGRERNKIRELKEEIIRLNLVILELGDKLDKAK